MFDIASQILAGALGGELIYTQGVSSEAFNIVIDRNLQVMDEDTGATQYINAASYANADFPFDKPLDGDTITATDRTWRVVRKAADDGHMTTLEVR